MPFSILNRKNLQYANYFDDFFVEGGYAKKYRQILFNPGKPLQTRELIQLQTILNEYNKNYLDTRFKNGSIINGCYVVLDEYNLNVGKGLIYFDGSVYKIDELTYVLGSEDNGNVTFGIKVKYEIVENDGNLLGPDATEKEELLDPALNYFEGKAVIGGDRLKVSFELVKITEEIDYQNEHVFDFVNFDYDYSKNSISNLKYLNRVTEFSDLVSENKEYIDKVIEGLTIQCDNYLDFIHGYLTKTNDIILGEKVIGDYTFVNINKGLGLVNGKYVPVSKNMIFKFQKPANTIDRIKNYKETSYYYGENVEKSGVYFKLYKNSDTAFNLGYPYNLFDPLNVSAVLGSERGKKIAIEYFDSTDNLWKEYAKANIACLDEDSLKDDDLDEDIWKKFPTKGFWKKDENYIYIKSLLQINSNYKFYKTGGGNVSLGPIFSCKYSTLKLSDPSLKITDVFKSAYAGGVQSLIFRHNFPDQNDSEKIMIKRKKATPPDDHMTYYQVRIPKEKYETYPTQFDFLFANSEGGIIIFKHYGIGNWYYIGKSNRSTPFSDSNYYYYDLYLFTLEKNQMSFKYAVAESIPGQISGEIGDTFVESTAYFAINNANWVQVDEYNNELKVFGKDLSYFVDDVNDVDNFYSYITTYNSFSPWEELNQYSVNVTNDPLNGPSITTDYSSVSWIKGNVNGDNKYKIIIGLPQAYDFPKIRLSSSEIGYNVPFLNVEGLEDLEFGAFLSPLSVPIFPPSECYGDNINRTIYYKIMITSPEVLSDYIINGKLTSIINTEDFGSTSNLKDLYSGHFNCKYNRVFLSDIILSGSDTTIGNLFSESRSYRIVFLDENGNKNYNMILQKGIKFYKTSDVEVLDEGSTHLITNLYNELEKPFVEDELNDNYITTLVNVDTKITNITVEGNVEWPEFSFLPEDRVLGISRAFGEISRPTLSGYKLKLYFKDAYGRAINNEYSPYYIDKNSIGGLDGKIISLENDKFYYDIKHQGYIVNGSGNLGINIYYYPNSKYVERISFLSSSYGVGRNVSPLRQFEILDDSGNKVEIINADGVQYYNKISTEELSLHITRNFLKNRYLQSGDYFLYDKVKENIIKYGAFGLLNIWFMNYSHSYLLKYKDTESLTLDVPYFGIACQLYDSDLNLTTRENYGKSNAGGSVNKYFNEIFDGHWYVIKNVGGGAIDWTEFGAPSSTVGVIFKMQNAGDLKAYFAASNGEGDDFPSIQPINPDINGNLIPNYYYKIVNYASGDNFVVSGAEKNENGVIFQANGTPPIWNNGSLLVMVVDPFNFNYDDVDQSSPSYGSATNGAYVKISGKNITIKPEVGDEIVLSKDIPDNITLSLYKEMPQTNNGLIIKNVVGIEHGAYKIYNPYIQIKEGINRNYGKVLNYKHKAIKYDSGANLLDVDIKGYVYVDYKYVLPNIVHFFLNEAGEVTYEQTDPTEVDAVQPYILNNYLYLGTIIVPPKLVFNDGTQIPFLNTNEKIVNNNDNLKKFIEDKNVEKELSYSRKMISLHEIYANERRDICFSTNENFKVWKVLTGTVKNPITDVGFIFNVTEFPTDNTFNLAKQLDRILVKKGLNNEITASYGWFKKNLNELIGEFTDFRKELKPGDIIGFFGSDYQVYDIIVWNIVENPGTYLNNKFWFAHSLGVIEKDIPIGQVLANPANYPGASFIVTEDIQISDYSSSITYSKDDIVKDSGTNIVYKSLKINNRNHALSDGNWWTQVGNGSSLSWNKNSIYLASPDGWVETLPTEDLVSVSFYYKQSFNVKKAIYKNLVWGIADYNFEKTPDTIFNNQPLETYMVKSVENDNKIILSDNLTLIPNPDKTDSYVVKSFLREYPLFILGKYQKTIIQNLAKKPIYVMKEQKINFVQYLMNIKNYNVFDIINKSSIIETNIIKDNLVFTKKGDFELENEKASINIINNELSAKLNSKFEKINFIVDNNKVDEYENSNQLSLKEIGEIKIIDTKTYFSGSFNFDSPKNIKLNKPKIVLIDVSN